MTLKELEINEYGKIIDIGSNGIVRRRLMDMGLTPGATIMMKKVAPFGDPIEINVRGYSLSIRKSEATKYNWSVYRVY